LSNISTSNGAIFGLQLGKSKGAGGNPELANVINLMVIENIIESVSASSAIMGMEIVSNSINAMSSSNKISYLQGPAGSSVYALEVAIIGNGTVKISKSIVSHIVAGQQAVGMVIVAMGDLSLENNQVSSISKANASVAMLGLGLLNNATLKNNSASDITSPSIAAGIVGVALAHLDMIHNRVNGANDVSMVAAGFNTTEVTGNNIERGWCRNRYRNLLTQWDNKLQTVSPIITISRTFYFPTSDPALMKCLNPLMMPLKNIQELEPILKPIRDDLDKLLHQLENNNTNARYNWYGTNSPDAAKFFLGNGTLNYYPWLVLNISANPSTIKSTMMWRVVITVQMLHYSSAAPE